MKWEAKARRAEETQTYTTSAHRLEQNGLALRVHIQGIPPVSPIHWGVCAFHAIPALQLCHWCFSDIVANICSVKIVQEGTVRYRCQLYAEIRSERAKMREHVLDIYLPRRHVEHRYPLTSKELEVIAAEMRRDTTK